MDLIVLADRDGVVDMTPESISRITNRPLEIIKRTILELEGPDPRSRTAEEGGARIRRLDDHRDWGWLIINFDKFRATATEDQYREKTRERVRKYRQNIRKTPNVTPCNVTVTPCNGGVTPPSASAYVSASASEEGGTGEDSGLPTLEQAIARTMVVGIPKDFCRYVYDDWATRGGKDASGVVVDWLRYVTKRWSRERSQWVNGSHAGKKKVAAHRTVQ